MFKNYIKKIENLLTNNSIFKLSYNDEILSFLEERSGREIWIAVAGKTGVGKSTLFNTLFEPNPPLRVGDGKPGTPDPVTHKFELSNGRGQIKYTDVPGIGESEESEENIENMCIEIFKKCDLIIWLFKCDDTSKAIEQKFYNKLDSKIKSKIVYGLSKIDQASGNWNNKGHQPSVKQMEFILNRIDDISVKFNIDKVDIIPFSIKKEYNVDLFINRIILVAKGLSDVVINKISPNLVSSDIEISEGVPA